MPLQRRCCFERFLALRGCLLLGRRVLCVLTLGFIPNWLRHDVPLLLHLRG